MTFAHCSSASQTKAGVCSICGREAASASGGLPVAPFSKHAAVGCLPCVDTPRAGPYGVNDVLRKPRGRREASPTRGEGRWERDRWGAGSGQVPGWPCAAAQGLWRGCLFQNPAGQDRNQNACLGLSEPQHLCRKMDSPQPARGKSWAPVPGDPLPSRLMPSRDRPCRSPSPRLSGSCRRHSSCRL